MSLAVARFTRTSFTALLRSEALRCLRVGIERQWLRPVPEGVIYYFPSLDRPGAPRADAPELTVHPDSLLTEEEAVERLFREEDGFFRSEIVLSPLAVTERATVIEVSLRNPAWTNKVPTGKLAFPHEPFQLRGPQLPPGWREGQSIPLISLPRLRMASAE